MRIAYLAAIVMAMSLFAGNVQATTFVFDSDILIGGDVDDSAVLIEGEVDAVDADVLVEATKVVSTKSATSKSTAKSQSKSTTTTATKVSRK